MIRPITSPASETSEHSPIGFSSADRWMNCPGSVRLSRTAPKGRSSSYADEGTVAHALAAQWLLSTDPPSNMDDETRKGLRVYIDAVAAALPKRVVAGSKYLVEGRVKAPELHRDVRGTVDALIWDAHEKHLHVIDLKWGRGIVVEAIDNRQLLGYAVTAALQLKIKPKHITLTIVQPRADHEDGPVRSWAVDAFALDEFGEEIRQAAAATDKPDAPLVPGKWCRFCPAAALCPALEDRATALALSSFKPVVDETYDKPKLARALEFIEEFGAWAKAVHQFAFMRAVEGDPPPGWKLVAKRAARVWKDEGAALEALTGPLEDFDLTAPQVLTTKLKSPPQVEALLPKPKRAALAALYDKRSSGPTLVRDSDKRPAIAVRPEDVFQVVEAEGDESDG